MNNTSRRGLIFSIILHSGFFLVIFFSFIGNRFTNKKIVRHNFQLQVIPLQQLENKKIVSKIENKLENKAIFEEQKPVDTKNKEENKEENRLKKSSVEKNTKSTISYNDFIKKQKPSNKKGVKVTSAPKAVEIPKIKTNKVGNDLQKKLSSIKTLTASELIDYESYLYSVIDAAWDCPKSFEGYKNSALFVFEVDVNGRIIKVKVAQTSGSKVFDESVTQAFKKIASVKPNPTGRGSEFQLTFSKK